MNKQKGLAPILIILLIALVVGGYLVYQKQTKPVVPQPVTQSAPNPVTSPVASSSAETANPDSIGAKWKTYSGTSYTFKYPSNGNVLTEQSSDVYISADTQPYFAFIVKTVDNPKHQTTQQVIDQMIIDLRNNKNIPWAKSQADQTSQTMRKYVNGQIKGIKLQSFDEGYPQKFGEVIEATEDVIYTFNIGDGSGGGVSDNDEKLLDQILSTFKFLP